MAVGEFFPNVAGTGCFGWGKINLLLFPGVIPFP